MGHGVVVPAPSRALGLHFFHGRWEPPPVLVDVAEWVQREVQNAASFLRPVSRSLRATLSALPTGDARAFVRALAPHASDPDRALEALEAMPDFPARFAPKPDIDRAIELGARQLEAERAQPTRYRAGVGTGESASAYTVLGLAAAFHHRGCAVSEASPTRPSATWRARSSSIHTRAISRPRRSLPSGAAGSPRRSRSTSARSMRPSPLSRRSILTARNPSA